ncbi:hypothetical protein QOZ80_9AG0693020 [Eleusine coracana subsp. coracana]|nr:hypothetical protein QOZ80_9AG0693020 [Eleusine coracana subsp. coracana]
MASLLVGKTTGEWIEVCNCIVFRDKKQNPQVSDTEWILSLSYYDLPPHLKTCLLYISVFPEGYVIHKYPLIWKWVAEGFVHKEQGTRLFEIGEGYFNELINRSMIQAVESEKKGIITGCRIHDMVLDLLRVKSQEENFVSIVSGDNEDISLPKRVRRLAHQNRKVVLDHEDAQADLRHVRTFIAIASWNDTLSFPSFQLLRVLALEDFIGWDRICLNHIQNLLHLRYLGLSGTAICELPEGIGVLKFLQILDLERTNVNKFPSSLGLLTQLIGLRAQQDRCVLVTDGVIEKLTSLEELRGITLGQFVKDLGNLHELRVLEVYLGFSEELDESMSIESDLLAALGNLRKIRHVRLDGYITKPDKAIWDAALLPRSLQCLNLSHICFSLMPSCINPSVLLNLTHLDLDVRRMDEQSLRILGRLPELRDLKLSVWSTITIIIRAFEDGCFHKLVSLTIPGAAILFLLNEDSTISFTIWYFTDDVAFDSKKRDECIVRAPTVMPNLQLLDFHVGVQTFIRNKGSCDRLGLEYLPSLRKVKVEFWCSNAFVDEVEKEEAALRHAIEAHPNRPTLEMHREGRIKTRSRPATHDLEIEEDEDVGSSMDVATRSRGDGH